ncbi:hypothetical protein DVH05_026208 [Phytophthora capsici]|nr:hypothetical protein DVH05_026208 [Phytophthora capsici]
MACSGPLLGCLGLHLCCGYEVESVGFFNLLVSWRRIPSRFRVGTGLHRLAVLSYEDAKFTRKALVVFVHELLTQTDVVKERSAKLKQFGEQLLRGFEDQTAPSSEASDSGFGSYDMHVKALFEESGKEERV